ncbi:MAG: hypothetical protein HQL99_13255 [Magnetococcales bacterium]|nr:hypothetical protein [Magnetococcales bacterium]
MAEKSKRWLTSSLVVGIWGVLLPWVWFSLLADQISCPKDLDRLAEWVKLMPWLHVIVLGLIFQLIPRLYELRHMDQLDRRLRTELTLIVDLLSWRLIRMAMVVVVSGLVCFAAPMVKGSDGLRFAMIFLAGSTVYFSLAILLASLALLMETMRQKTRILDHDSDKKKQIALIEALKKDREVEYRTREDLDKYNEFIQPPTTQIH